MSENSFDQLRRQFEHVNYGRIGEPLRQALEGRLELTYVAFRNEIDHHRYRCLLVALSL